MGDAKGADIAAFRRLRREMDAVTERMLERAKGAQEKDRGAAERVLREAGEIGRAGQAYQGQLLMMLAQAQRIGAVPGGLDTWIATHLDVTRGTANGIMKQAKAVGMVPALAAPLASGKVGSGTISALTRTARAVRHEGKEEQLKALTSTLKVAARGGAENAKRHVQVLEQTHNAGRAQQNAAQARERSYLRAATTASGMCRIEALLDPERATIVRATLDQTVSALLRARQYDRADLVPADVHSTEQLQAEALVRFAQNFALTDPATRGELAFTTPTLKTASLDPTANAGLSESVYGQTLPRTILPEPGQPGTHLLAYDAHGEPVLLDGAVLDPDPARRLANTAQRTALVWRECTCTHSGCTRPPTCSLHTHHRIPVSHDGPSAVRNLTGQCPIHHTLTHLQT